MIITIPYMSKAEITYTICEFHTQHPGESFAGCTCSANYSVRPMSWDEAMEQVLEKRKGALDELAKQ